MNFKNAALLIQTNALADSNVENMILTGPGTRVTAPSMVRGNLYIMEEWETDHKIGDNPYTVVQFLGCGAETDNIINFVEKNIGLANLTAVDRYYFKAYDTNKEDYYTFGAQQVKKHLGVGDAGVRVTFKMLKDAEHETIDYTSITLDEVAPVSEIKAEVADRVVKNNSDDDFWIRVSKRETNNQPVNLHYVVDFTTQDQLAVLKSYVGDEVGNTYKIAFGEVYDSNDFMNKMIGVGIDWNTAVNMLSQ